MASLGTLLLLGACEDHVAGEPGVRRAVQSGDSTAGATAGSGTQGTDTTTTHGSTAPAVDSASGTTSDTGGTAQCPADPWVAPVAPRRPASGTELTSHTRYRLCVDPVLGTLTGSVQLTWEDGESAVCDWVSYVVSTSDLEAPSYVGADQAWSIVWSFPAEHGTTLCLPVGIEPNPFSFDDLAVGLDHVAGSVWTQKESGWEEILDPGSWYYTPFTMAEQPNGTWSVSADVTRTPYVIP